MPYLAIDLDAMEKAPNMARAAGIPEDTGMAGIARMWLHCWREETDQVDATNIRGFFGADAAPALVSFRFLEPREGGFRVRGAERYLRITKARKAGGQASRKNLIPGAVHKKPERASSPSAVAEEQPKEVMRSASALSASSEQRAAIETSSPSARAREEAKPPPPPPTPDNLSAALELWNALEQRRSEATDTRARPEPPPSVREDLLAFSKAHDGDVGWALDTQERFFTRDPKYARGLNPPGATEVLLKPTQWPKFQQAPPEPKDVCADCGKDAETVWWDVPVCYRCLGPRIAEADERAKGTEAA